MRARTWCAKYVLRWGRLPAPPRDLGLFLGDQTSATRRASSRRGLLRGLYRSLHGNRQNVVSGPRDRRDGVCGAGGRRSGLGSSREREPFTTHDSCPAPPRDESPDRARRQTDRQTDQRPTPTGRRRTDRLGRDTPPSPTNHTLTTPHRHHRRHKREPTRTQTAGPHSTHATRQALHILVQARARIHSPITRQRHGHTPGPTLGHAHHHPPPPAQQQATHRLTRVHGNLQSR